VALYALHASFDRSGSVAKIHKLMTTFLELTINIASDLHGAGFIEEADELQTLANLALDRSLMLDRRKDNLSQIEMRCHVKWLGDCYLPYLSQNDWWAKLERLAKLARKQATLLRDS
jgi:hypothetical protein